MPTHEVGELQSDLSSNEFTEEQLSEKFALTLQPVLRANCAACHGVNQAPKFAVENSLEAVRTIQSFKLANLSAPENSRFVAKIMSGHNGFTQTLAGQVQAGVQAWSDALNGEVVSGPDTQAPTVQITAPAAGANVSPSFSVSATAADNVGVVGVEFYIDGSLVGSEDLSAPFTLAVNLAAGVHDVVARARDAAGNETFSAPIAFTVVAPPVDSVAPTVAITAPAANASLSGSTTLTATASDNVGVVGVQFLIDNVAVGSEDLTAPYSITYNTAGLTNAPHSITAVARDAAGNMRTSAAVSFTVYNALPPPPDTEQPVVSVSAPSNGATVSGASVAVSASATDNVGVVGVQFFVNGVAQGAEDTTAPFAIVWNTTSLTNGSYALTARARDAAGNTRTSTAISVTVSNAVVNPNATYTWIQTNVLTPRCISCHGATSNDGGVRLHAYTNVRSTLSVGNANGSRLYNETKPGGSMPPSGAKLSTDQVNAIRDWINAGALNN